MHRHDSRSPQVNAHFWLRLGLGIPSISTAYAQAWRRCAQVIHMFVHRQQGSSRLVRWQAAVDRHGTPVPAGPANAPRASLRDTLAPCRARTTVRHCRAHLVRSWEPGREPGRALVGTDMILVLANPNHYPLPTAGEFYAIYRLLRHSCVGWRRTSISVRCEPIANRRLLKLN
jgi:hypothetical protein